MAWIATTAAESVVNNRFCPGRIWTTINPESWSPPACGNFAGRLVCNATWKVNEDGAVESTGFAIPAWRCEKNTRLGRAFLSGIRSQGGEPRFVYKTGTADLSIVAPVWKCPAVVYGPGDSALDHTPNGRISLEEYGKAVQVLHEALMGLMKRT